MEYIALRYGRVGSAFQYELLTDCNEPGNSDHIGLLDIEKLRVRQQPDGKKDHLSGGCRRVPRQVQLIDNPLLSLNLTACSERTSGTPKELVMS